MLWNLAITGYQLKVSFVRLILQDFALQQGIVPLYGLNRMIVIMYSFRSPLTSVPTSVSRNLVSKDVVVQMKTTCTQHMYTRLLEGCYWLFYGCTQVQSISNLTTYNIIYTFVYNSLSFLVLFWLYHRTTFTHKPVWWIVLVSINYNLNLLPFNRYILPHVYPSIVSFLFKRNLFCLPLTNRK